MGAGVARNNGETPFVKMHVGYFGGSKVPIYDIWIYILQVGQYSC